MPHLGNKCVSEYLIHLFPLKRGPKQQGNTFYTCSNCFIVKCQSSGNEKTFCGMKQSSRLILCGGIFCKLKCSLTADLCLNSAGFSKGLCCIILGWIRKGHLGFLYSLMGRSVNKKGNLSKPLFVEITWWGFCKLLIPLNAETVGTEIHNVFGDSHHK